MKIFRIILGWWLWVTNQNNKMAQERLQHCVNCEYRKGMTCSLCGCVLKAKARVKQDDCPDKRWPEYYIWYEENKYWYDKDRWSK